jgi:CRISPR/Cas system-associated endonuclease Cas1
MPVNMSHCQFTNTLAALKECYDRLGAIDSLEELGEVEAAAARKLFKLCERVSGDWCDESVEVADSG